MHPKQLSDQFDYGKLISSGNFSVGGTVTILLGYDGSVIDIISNGDQDNSGYALVIDAYSEVFTAIGNFGSTLYFVNLLQADGSRETYRMSSDMIGLKGDLVMYTVTGKQDVEDEYDTVQMEQVEYNSSKRYVVNKEERQIDENYLADNVVIFNLVHNIYGRDSEAYLMSWSEFPNGTIPQGKIKYINKAGAFEDINVIFTDNILDEGLCLGLVTDIKTSWSIQTGTLKIYTVMINGEEYETNDTLAGATVGSVIEVRMSGGKILSSEEIKSVWTESTRVQAVDSNRIKVNGKIYKFNSDITMYYKEYNGEYQAIGVDNIDTAKNYGKVAVYLDKHLEYGGKAEVIILMY